MSEGDGGGGIGGEGMREWVKEAVRERESERCVIDNHNVTEGR